MADESTSPAGTRFSEDLRRIREDRGISIQEIQQDTQIAETLIESFEEARLYDHPTYNRVYLRSFVEAYAGAIGISQEQALEGLDAALDGSYDHGLADAYLTDRADPPPVDPPADSNGGDSKVTPSDQIDAPTAGGPEGRGGIVGPPRAVGEEPEEDAASASEPTPPSSSSEDASGSASASPPGPDASSDESREDDEAEPDDSDSRPRDAGEPPDSSVPPPPPDPSGREGDGDDPSARDREPPAVPDGRTEDESIPSGGETGIVGEPTALGADQSGSAPDSSSLGDPSIEGGPVPSTPVPSEPSSSETNSRMYVIGLGIAVVVLILIGLGVAYFSVDGASESSAQEASMVSTSDTVSTSAPADTMTNRPPPADVQLGSAIHLTLQARTDVSGIRVQRDDDLRRPYWIQEGDADVFPFQNQVTIDRRLSDVRLFIEGYPYPVQPRDTTGEFEITRSDVKAFVDTLRGAPASLAVSPDTIAVGEPNP